MDKFTQLSGVAAPMPMINIDTDKIFPAIHLRTIKRTGLAKHLFEEVRFNKSYVTSSDWVSYPILRFKDSPGFTPVIVQRTDQPTLGSGEPPTCPIIGAVANAFFDATGVRLHEAPFTPARVRATLKAAAAGQTPVPGA